MLSIVHNLRLHAGRSGTRSPNEGGNAQSHDMLKRRVTNDGDRPVRRHVMMPGCKEALLGLSTKQSAVC